MAVTDAQASWVRTSSVMPGQTLPLVVEPAHPDFDGVRWATRGKDFIDRSPTTSWRHSLQRIQSSDVARIRDFCVGVGIGSLR